MTHLDVKIDDEFRDLIPPLTDEEYSDLENEILSDGVRHPLVVWEGHDILVDGHNRLSICRKHDLTFDVEERKFESREDVKIWIIRNQLGRRNLNDYNMGRVRLQLKSLYEERAKHSHAIGVANGAKATNATRWGGDRSLQNFAKSDTSEPNESISPDQDQGKADGDEKSPYEADVPIEVVHVPDSQQSTSFHTMEEIAKDAGISRFQLQKIEKIEDEAIDGIKKLASTDKLSVNAAYDASKMKPKRQQEIVDRIESGERPREVMREAHKQEREEREQEQIEESESTATLFVESSVGKVIACDALITEAPSGMQPGEWLYSSLSGVRHDGFAYVVVDGSLETLTSYLTFETPPNIKLAQVLTWSFKYLLGNANKRLYKPDSKFILLYRGVDAGNLNFSVLQERSSVMAIDAEGGSLGTPEYELRFPMELAERLVRHATHDGFTVFDPFAGTGTILLAAKKLGRDSVGYEADQAKASVAFSRGVVRG